MGRIREQRIAIGMLLDARWNETKQVFEKVTKGVTPNGGIPYHWIEYFDRYGNKLEVNFKNGKAEES